MTALSPRLRLVADERERMVQVRVDVYQSMANELAAKNSDMAADLYRMASACMTEVAAPLAREADALHAALMSLRPLAQAARDSGDDGQPDHDLLVATVLALTGGDK